MGHVAWSRLNFALSRLIDIIDFSWDEAYASELHLFHQQSSTTTDDDEEHDTAIGNNTNWFSEQSASTKIRHYLDSLSLDRQTTSFLDLGTGNGHLLFELRELGGYAGSMLGVDYSATSIELARRRLDSRRGSRGNTRFEKWDILSDPPSSLHRSTTRSDFDVVLDKGTFDAISLSAEVDGRGRRICEGYAARVALLLKPETGRLIVTSCNWTEEELSRWFTTDTKGVILGEEHNENNLCDQNVDHRGEKGLDENNLCDQNVDHKGEKGLERRQLEVCDRIEYPSFVFGGKRGQSISSVVFRRRSLSIGRSAM